MYCVYIYISTLLTGVLGNEHANVLPVGCKMIKIFWRWGGDRGKLILLIFSSFHIAIFNLSIILRKWLISTKNIIHAVFLVNKKKWKPSSISNYNRLNELSQVHMGNCFVLIKYVLEKYLLYDEMPMIYLQVKKPNH